MVVEGRGGSITWLFGEGEVEGKSGGEGEGLEIDGDGMVEN